MFTEGHSRPPPPSRRRRSSAAVALSFDDLAELRSLGDEQLCMTDHGTLLCALKLQWDENDQMKGRLEVARGDEQGSRDKLEDTLGALSDAVARYEDGLQDQDRLESEVQGRNELLDRLRQWLTTKDGELRESERRYAEQERSFEAERQAFISQEAHLKAQVHSRTIPLLPSSPQPGLDDARIDALHDELQTMTTSQEALQNHLGALAQELQDVKKINTQLREENDGWQALLTDQTMSGTIREGSGMLSRVLSDGSGALGVVSGANRKKRPNVRQHMLEVDSTVATDVKEDELADDPLLDSDLASEQQPGESLEGIPVTGSGLDLAAELGRAEVSQGGEMRVLGKGDEGEALRAEVKHLRDANKALSLYCFKIIDRIIAKEGYEDILAADYAKEDFATRPREVSRGARSPVKVLPQPIMTSPVENPPNALTDSSSEKRTRRGLSMDWGLGKVFKSFTGPSQPSPASTKPGLRPLSLSSKPAGLPVAPLGARKLEAHDEDEEDARERHRMQAALKLMGVTEEQAPSSESPPERGVGRYWLPGLHKLSTGSKEATSPPHEANHKAETTHKNL